MKETVLSLFVKHMAGSFFSMALGQRAHGKASDRSSRESHLLFGVTERRLWRWHHNSIARRFVPIAQAPQDRQFAAMG